MEVDENFQADTVEKCVKESPNKKEMSKHTKESERSTSKKDKIKVIENKSETVISEKMDVETPAVGGLKSLNDIPLKSLNESQITDQSLTPSSDSQASPTTELAHSSILRKTFEKTTEEVRSVAESILSPPKSETQTDETNTVSSSSSPSSTSASDSHLSPVQAEEISKALLVSKKSDRGKDETENEAKSDNNGDSAINNETNTLRVSIASHSKPINVVANGTIPKSGGKPLITTLNKKLNKTPSPRPVRTRKPRIAVAIYESEISNNTSGIKLCIKKSDSAGTNSSPTVNDKQNRKRVRKSKVRTRFDSDDSEFETKKRKERSANNSAGERQKRVSVVTSGGNDDAMQYVEQSAWGAKIPDEILLTIFERVVDMDGCLPTLWRLGRVCSLWRRVSLSTSLWKVLDLSTFTKEKNRNELKLKWFVDNRCRSCTDLNVSNWKVSDIMCFLTKLAAGCPNLNGITLTGWKNFTSDHLTYLVNNMKKLERLDLSSINVEINASKTAVGLLSLSNALQTMGERLTHLYLAHNRLAGIPQIVNILSTYCSNLLLLDLSNVTTQATSHAMLHIEKLQRGCQKLKVLRITNSHVILSTASIQETMDSPGFPNLEELSVASLTDESRIFGDEHLQRILKTSSKLKLLDVRGCARLTHESLIRLPAWDIKHLFLSGCSVTRDVGSGLELIASKWAHSLIELDLAWANVQQPLDNALCALAEKGIDSPLAHLNLCGSSVSLEAAKNILANCALMSSINLSSCRGLPRGVKRLMQGTQELQELRDVLQVQMKVKLPAQIKREQEEAAAAASAKSSVNDSGGVEEGTSSTSRGIKSNSESGSSQSN